MTERPGRNAPNSILAGICPRLRWGDYSACPEPLAGRGLLLRGMEGRKGKRRGEDR